MFAAQHSLGGLVALVDANGQQALGATRDVIDTEPLAERWRTFGWDVHELDGHDADAIAETVAGLDPGAGPHLLVLRTVFGKGVSFMEGQLQWHYWPMSDDQYDTAMAEVGS
jgi:transketolase